MSWILDVHSAVTVYTVILTESYQLSKPLLTVLKEWKCETLKRGGHAKAGMIFDGMKLA